MSCSARQKRYERALLGDRDVLRPRGPEPLSEEEKEEPHLDVRGDRDYRDRRRRRGGLHHPLSGGRPPRRPRPAHARWAKLMAGAPPFLPRGGRRAPGGFSFFSYLRRGGGGG